MSPTHDFPWTEAQFAEHLRKAVRNYWKSRGGQSKSQVKRGITDVGTRGEVTGGQHLNAVLKLLVETVRASGFSNEDIKLNAGRVALRLKHEKSIFQVSTPFAVVRGNGPAADGEGSFADVGKFSVSVGDTVNIAVHQGHANVAFRYVSGLFRTSSG